MGFRGTPYTHRPMIGSTGERTSGLVLLGFALFVRPLVPTVEPLVLIAAVQRAAGGDGREDKG